MVDSIAIAQREKRLKRNLVLIPIARALNMALLGQAVFNVFWSRDIGLDVQKIFTLQVVNSISVVSLEIPSGITSDTLGRKKTLVIACALKIAAFVVYGSAHSFVTCCIAEFLLAAGSAAWSGTDTAILYETAAELNRSAEALDRESSNVFVSQTVEGSCAILGGFLATWGSVRLAVSATALPFVMACLVTFGLIEPNWKSPSPSYEPSHLSDGVELEDRAGESDPIDTEDLTMDPLKEYIPLHSKSPNDSDTTEEVLQKGNNFESISLGNSEDNIDVSNHQVLSREDRLDMDHGRVFDFVGCQCFRLFHHQWILVAATLQMSQVFEAMCSTIFVSCATYTAVWFYQLLFERANMSLDAYGPSWAVLNFAVALGAYLSPIFYRKLGLFLTQSILGLWLLSCFIALGLWISPWVVVIGCLLNMVRGINQPMFITHLNHLLPSSCRATMGSVYSLGTRLLFSGGALILGIVSRVYNLTVACIICGIFYGGAAVIFGFMFHRTQKQSSRSSFITIATED
ncbi:hypothetical protein Gasu2_36130 [Galdieria sulphuraria]|uniref:MFS transporter n=1 Tax=Galdieria sulphuraria TaxID=130081 RepID=M2XB79_GALSU|nr:MFS transporter [Galdieria sulphuraria]EME27162.1 MFS transporter [Galdieria sulphuraria]GJD09356.1 hypothetical protein Gasu2_36130 [Galdieria sulphuraria]|eukprot:XP_005703682.1 MFS transporter [Galdieria sulphuraria]